MEVFEVYKAKRDRAMQTLARLGAIRFADNMEMFHGRSGDGSPWKVNPQYNNAGNNTGHHNLYNVSGLYAASESVAKRFAIARSRTGGVPEVHQIMAQEGAVLVDMHFSYSSLTQAQRVEFRQALNILNDFPITKGVVIPFEKREIFTLAKNAIEEVKNKSKTSALPASAVTDITNTLSKEPIIRQTFASKNELHLFIQDFVGAINSKVWLLNNMKGVINNYMTNSSPNIDNVEYPLSSKYISAWCANNGVIGAITDIDSATLGGRVNDIVHIFDTAKIATERQYGEMYQEMLSKYSRLSELLDGVSSNDDINQFLRDANPKEIMKLIQQNPTCKQLFQMNSGVWEKWTVGQHTQAVLQFFEDNYKDDVLDEIYPLIKVALLVHDAGKGISFRDNISQERANKQVVPIVLDALNIKREAREIINFLISQPYTSQIVLGKGKKRMTKALCGDIKDLYEQIFKEKPIKNDIKGLAELAIILQTCDSGAYTRYAKVTETTGALVSGGSDRFTASFVNSNGKPRLRVFEEGFKID